MLEDKLALLDAMAGKEPTGRLQVYDYIVLVHPARAHHGS